jgi:hypothetical protein
MASPFDKVSVPQSVQNELTARQGKNGILWTAQRFPWILVTSMSSICNDKYKTLASNSKDRLYEEGYVRPLPVVTQVDIKKKGNLGTTKQVNINITAFTDAQLLELQKCYFIPGLSVRAEWGWSLKASGLALTSGPIDKSIKLDCLAIPAIMKKQENDPSYCGVQGVVANFSYKLTDQNFWECTLEITGVAEAFATAPINSVSCDECQRKAKQDEGSKESEKTKALPPFQTWCYDLHENNKTEVWKQAEAFAKSDAKTPPFDKRIAYNGSERQLKAEDTGIIAGIVSSIGGAIKWAGKTVTGDESITEHYVNMYYIAAAANLFFKPAISSGKCGTSDLGRVDFKDVFIKYNKNVFSTDPRVCLLPGTSNQRRVITNATDIDVANTCVTEDGKIELGRILVNAYHLHEIYKNVSNGEEASVSDFLTSLLGSINNVCGNLWDFSVVSYTEDSTKNANTPTLTVIDNNCNPKGKVEPYSIPAQPTNSLLRSLDMELKLTNSMKMQAIYGTNTAPAASADTNNQPTKCTQEAYRAFSTVSSGVVEGINEGKEYISEEEANEIKKKICSLCEKTKDESVKTKTFIELINDLQEEVSDETVAAVQQQLITEYSNESKKKENKNDCIGVPLPFGFKFSLDGVGGLKFGQMVTCNRLPQQVQNVFEYQITAVNHTVTVNDWVTSVETVGRLKPQ